MTSLYDQRMARTPDEDEPSTGIEESRVLGDGLGVRHSLEAHLAAGGTIDISCWECSDAFTVVARIPPKPFLCPRCSGRQTEAA